MRSCCSKPGRSRQGVPGLRVPLGGQVGGDRLPGDDDVGLAVRRAHGERLLDHPSVRYPHAQPAVGPAAVRVGRGRRGCGRCARGRGLPKCLVVDLVRAAQGEPQLGEHVPVRGPEPGDLLGGELADGGTGVREAAVVPVDQGVEPPRQGERHRQVEVVDRVVPAMPCRVVRRPQQHAGAGIEEGPQAVAGRAGDPHAGQRLVPGAVRNVEAVLSAARAELNPDSWSPSARRFSAAAKATAAAAAQSSSGRPAGSPGYVATAAAVARCSQPRSRPRTRPATASRVAPARPGAVRSTSASAASTARRSGSPGSGRRRAPSGERPRRRRPRRVHGRPPSGAPTRAGAAAGRGRPTAEGWGARGAAAAGRVGAGPVPPTRAAVTAPTSPPGAAAGPGGGAPRRHRRSGEGGGQSGLGIMRWAWRERPEDGRREVGDHDRRWLGQRPAAPRRPHLDEAQQRIGVEQQVVGAERDVDDEAEPVAAADPGDDSGHVDHQPSRGLKGSLNRLQSRLVDRERLLEEDGLPAVERVAPPARAWESCRVAITTASISAPSISSVGVRGDPRAGPACDAERARPPIAPATATSRTGRFASSGSSVERANSPGPITPSRRSPACVRWPRRRRRDRCAPDGRRRAAGVAQQDRHASGLVERRVGSTPSVERELVGDELAPAGLGRPPPRRRSSAISRRSVQRT